jgi:hypothetical protein
MTYLKAGDRQKAETAFGRLADVDKEGTTFNDIAYEMANADLNLPLALDYARKAVRKMEGESQKITLTDLKVEDLRKIQSMAAYWDTLGWVDERMSNFDEAEQYLRASWKLTQDGTVASHLCHLYEREHKIASAIEMCSLALDRLPVSAGSTLHQGAIEMAETKRRLDQLKSGADKSRSAVDAAGVVVRERTFKLPRFLPGTESSEFFVLLASDGKAPTFKVESVKFISGSDKMKLLGEKQLKSIAFNFPAPGHASTHFVRRGILGCYQYSGCSFVLLDPSTVTSIN